jgi:hypothetical protein
MTELHYVIKWNSKDQLQSATKVAFENMSKGQILKPPNMRPIETEQNFNFWVTENVISLSALQRPIGNAVCNKNYKKHINMCTVYERNVESL